MRWICVSFSFCFFACGGASFSSQVAATELSLSPESSCALFSDSKVRCWGDVFVSQSFLGFSTKEVGQRRPAIVGTGSYSEVVNLQGHVCIRRAEDSVLECRENATTEHEEVWRELPELADTGPFSNNGWTACAATPAGAIKCLDVHADVDANRYVLEVVELEDFDASEVFVGTGHLGVLTNAGEFLTFGVVPENPEIRIGLPLPLKRQDLKSLPELQGAISLDVGAHFFLEHGAALFPDGRVFAYGAWTDTPGWKSGLEQITDIALGNAFGCALRDDHHLLCWGGNRVGQLGDGSEDDRASPQQIAGLEHVESIAASDSHACAIAESGRVFCWGVGLDGQLGQGDLENSSSPREVEFEN